MKPCSHTYTSRDTCIHCSGKRVVHNIEDTIKKNGYTRITGSPNTKGHTMSDLVFTDGKTFVQVRYYK